MKIKHGQSLKDVVSTGVFRITAEGRIETNRKWNGHQDIEVDWYECDRPDGKGYRYVSWHMVRVKAHRLAYCLYHPEDDITDFEVNHLDGDRLNNRCGNLEKCDTSRQSKHAFDTGLNLSRGEGHRLAVLTDDGVREMRALRQLGVPYSVLARRFGVTPTAARFACLGKTWAHVK